MKRLHFRCKKKTKVYSYEEIQNVVREMGDEFRNYSTQYEFERVINRKFIDLSQAIDQLSNQLTETISYLEQIRPKR